MKTCPVCDSDYPDQHTTCPTDGAVLIVSRELAAGSTVRGKYRIERKLGQGGMGVVYLAEHILLGGRVALKFLTGDLGKDPRFIKRFRMEARAAYQLRDPNIVEVLDLDQAEDGSLFIAMEYVEGPSLRDVLMETPGGLEIPRELELARGIASGLAAAHAHGTVHRDIKPENILLAHAANGREWPKILDFGIAAMAESVTRLSLTRGLLLTPEYAAPEQWEEMPAAEMDGRTDLYALGCVFYEMLTGRPPFHAHSTSGWMKQHLEETPARPSELRPELADWPGLDGLAMRLLAKNRDDRPLDAELLTLLDEVWHGPGQKQPEVAAEERLEGSGTIVEGEWGRPGMVPAPLPQPVLQPVIPMPRPRARRFPGWARGALAILALAAIAVAVRLFAPQLQPQPQQAQALVTQPASSPAPVQSLDSHDAQPSMAEEPPRVSASDAKPAVGKPVSPQEQKPAVEEVKPPADKPSIPKPSPGEMAQQAIALYDQKRYAEAGPLLDQACASGGWEACKDLGIMYRDGRGVAEDDSRAAALFAKDCQADPPNGCNRLGVMVANGKGVARDDARAAALYATACNAGDAMGCSNLGNIYATGRGVTRDDAQAASLYLKACEAGDAPGCSNLGNSYRFGRGVEKDSAKARQFLDKGCKMGNQWGCDRLKEMP
jgi:serine/threonine-protein kinase